MYVTELRIDDFGCFQNARIENVDDGLVVIGGPQRAGKSTFMEAFRQFPTGVGKQSDLPPATDEYRIDAEISHDGHSYRYVLNGHSSPSVSAIGDGPELESSDIFGPVTDRQYRNIHTISLDELRQLPPGIDDTEDLARVLLGGAYGDIAEIPDLRGEFQDQAHDIGLKRGSPTAKTTDLHDPYQQIRDGLQQREEASKQVEEYRSVTEELHDMRGEQSDIDTELSLKQRRRDRLNILTELFDPIQEIDSLDTRLADEETDSIEEFPSHLTDRLEHFEAQFNTATSDLRDAKSEFEQTARLDTSEEYREWLHDNESEIDELADNRNLWSQTVEDLSQTETELEATRRTLEDDIESLHPEWDGSFAHIDAIDTSTIDSARIADQASSVEALQEEQGNLEAELDRKRSKRDELQSQLEEMDDDRDSTEEVSVPIRKPAIIAGVALLVGTGAGFFINPIVGGVIGFIILGAGIYTIDTTVNVESTVDTDAYRETSGQITTLEGDISSAKDRLRTVEEALEEEQQAIQSLAETIGLPDDLSPTHVAQFYDQVGEIDDRIDAYRRERTQWEENRDELIDDLEELSGLFEEIADISWSEETVLEDAPALLSALDDASADLELAREVYTAEQERAEEIENIDSVLSEWDAERSIGESTSDDEVYRHVEAFKAEAERVSEVEAAESDRDSFTTQIKSRFDGPSAREAFEPFREADEPWIDVVRSAAEEYADTDAIGDDIRELQGEIDRLEDRREELQEACIELEQRVDELASETDLQEAQATIDEARVEFERLGEAYAVNRIAESMVKQLHERLMEDVVHSLVDDASTIFQNITQEYDGIELGDDVQELEFRALRDSAPDHRVGELSRATAEQLFLAIRLARIRQTDVALPVIIDDAATNFDPGHVSRVFQVVNELLSHNQVFFLTCHPDFVRSAARNGTSAQYWPLDQGRFEGHTSADKLAEFLDVD
ncbi:AAA family ATPase [Salinarchaeum laminariae]|uniref:AAA family ATPase n=1 Tax=Salinarchaeum laminariae TaxID=869888 RepID=UPI0020C0B054|nr:AAA family ATPase [Salinarchaeum laminariae]